MLKMALGTISDEVIFPNFLIQTTTFLILLRLIVKRAWVIINPTTPFGLLIKETSVIEGKF
jgi:hypothetical protein